MHTSEKQRKGFNVMDPALVKEIASLGGKAAHEQGTAHVWTVGAEAQAAGRRGGLISGQHRRDRKQAE